MNPMIETSITFLRPIRSLSQPLTCYPSWRIVMWAVVMPSCASPISEMTCEALLDADSVSTALITDDCGAGIAMLIGVSIGLRDCMSVRSGMGAVSVLPESCERYQYSAQSRPRCVRDRRARGG